jgi:hypothetical protein
LKCPEAAVHGLPLRVKGSRTDGRGALSGLAISNLRYYADRSFWAALDAYAERAPLPRGLCAKCGRRCSISPFTMGGRVLAAQLVDALYELDTSGKVVCEQMA